MVVCTLCGPLVDVCARNATMDEYYAAAFLSHCEVSTSSVATCRANNNRRTIMALP